MRDRSRLPPIRCDHVFLQCGSLWVYHLLQVPCSHIKAPRTVEFVDDFANPGQISRHMREPILERNLTVVRSVGNHLYENMICADILC